MLFYPAPFGLPQLFQAGLGTTRPGCDHHGTVCSALPGLSLGVGEDQGDGDVRAMGAEGLSVKGIGS